MLSGPLSSSCLLETTAVLQTVDIWYHVLAVLALHMAANSYPQHDKVGTHYEIMLTSTSNDCKSPKLPTGLIAAAYVAGKTVTLCPGGWG